MKGRKDAELEVVRGPVSSKVVARIKKHRAPRLQPLPPPSTSTSESKQYMWTPVDQHRKEIRVLDLDLGVGNSPLRGRLRHVVLGSSSKPKYETISYAWGDTTLVDNILVDNKSIPIPASAGSALRNLRASHTIRTLWIDCVCIDQKNDREKGHQVGMMADIFQSSRWTIAHLENDEDNTAKRAFDGIAVIYEALLDPAGGLEMVDVPHLKIKDWCSLRENIDLLAIKGIMTKPYFK